MNVPEILAPAGGRAAFYAALQAGADAIYLGLKDFNARARAENFTTQDVTELTALARHYEVKVLVAMNVLLKEAELPELLATLARLETAGVHALIVQDLGLLRILRTSFPSFRIHASTQMAIHNEAGVAQARELGIRRVVVAREITGVELAKIRMAFPAEEMELEAFCHGSLCYSYSGLCFFSGAKDARSGNRGECAYTCRKPYTITSEPGRGYLFSMRDLDASDRLDKLTDVDALKIEGRKKDAQYVATSVRLYRRKLDELHGRSTLRASAPPTARALASEEKPLEDLRALSFQRRATSFFLGGRYVENVIDLDEVSHRGVPIGEIEKVEFGVAWVVAKIPLERYDGVAIEEPAVLYHSLPQHGEEISGDGKALKRRFENENAAFSLRDFSVEDRDVPRAEPGDRVAIEWPTDRTLPKVGDLLVKTRSDELKRRVEKIARVPEDDRLRPLRPVTTIIDLRANGERLEIRVLVSGPRGPLGDAHATCEAQRPRKASTLKKDLEELFALYGEADLESRSVRVEGDCDWFVPRSVLKDLKRELALRLPVDMEKCVASAEKAALEALLPPVAHSPNPGPSRFSVKLDRIEFLEALAASPALPLDEVFFEPKRAFLGTLEAGDVLDRALAASERLGARLRLSLPTVLRSWDEPEIRKWIECFTTRGGSLFEVGNLGAVHLVRALGPASPDLATDFTLFALNHQASLFWSELGVSSVCLSVEDDLENLRAHLGRLGPGNSTSSTSAGTRAPSIPRMTAILYKDTPLFIAEACSLTALHDGCPTSKVCGYRSLEIRNEEGEEFVVAHERCKSVVYGKQAYAISERRESLEALGVRDFRVDFLTRPYAPEDAREILRLVGEGAQIPNTHTANFSRRLL